MSAVVHPKVTTETLGLITTVTKVLEGHRFLYWTLLPAKDFWQGTYFPNFGDQQELMDLITLTVKCAKCTNKDTYLSYTTFSVIFRAVFQNFAKYKKYWSRELIKSLKILTLLHYAGTSQTYKAYTIWLRSTADTT